MPQAVYGLSDPRHQRGACRDGSSWQKCRRGLGLGDLSEDARQEVALALGESLSGGLIPRQRESSPGLGSSLLPLRCRGHTLLTSEKGLKVHGKLTAIERPHPPWSPFSVPCVPWAAPRQ